MENGAVCLEAAALERDMPLSRQVKRAGCIKKKCSESTKASIDCIRVGQEKPMLILPRHIRLARASYATASDADIDENVPDQGEFLAGNKRTRNTKTDFWSRVDAGEINIQSALDAWRNNSNITPQSVVDTTIPNYAISTTNLSDYSYKTTVFGDVYYSPRFNDNKYTYRFVILTKGVRNEAYRILKSCGRHFLTEMQIIHQLGIDLSPGWEHFMVFRNKLEELILRRPLGS